MAIPAMPAPQPGGDYVSAMSNVNALHDAMLKSKMQQMQNQVQQIKMPYVGPKEQEELRKAQLYNQYYGPEKQATIAHQNLVNQFYGPNIQSEMAFRGAQTNKLNTMTPLEAEQLRLANQYYPKLTESQIANYQALANQRKLGLGGKSGVGMQELNSFKQQLQMDNPQWDEQTLNQAANAYMSGQNELNGQPLPPLSGMASTIQSQIFKRSSTAQIQNTAANMSNTANEINNIDIEPVKRFSGLKGRFDYAGELAKMQYDPNSVSPEFREYQAFKEATSILAMDTLRKGFGTSVVPDYVYATLGKLSRPESNIWNDPKQVEANWNKLKEWINKSAQSSVKQARYGATVDLNEKKPVGQQKKYSDTDIKFTAKKYNMTEAQVKQKLGIS